VKPEPPKEEVKEDDMALINKIKELKNEVGDLKKESKTLMDVHPVTNLRDGYKMTPVDAKSVGLGQQKGDVNSVGQKGIGTKQGFVPTENPPMSYTSNNSTTTTTITQDNTQIESLKKEIKELKVETKKQIKKVIEEKEKARDVWEDRSKEMDKKVNDLKKGIDEIKNNLLKNSSKKEHEMDEKLSKL